MLSLFMCKVAQDTFILLMKKSFSLPRYVVVIWNLMPLCFIFLFSLALFGLCLFNSNHLLSFYKC